MFLCAHTTVMSQVHVLSAIKHSTFCKWCDGRDGRAVCSWIMYYFTASKGIVRIEEKNVLLHSLWFSWAQRHRVRVRSNWNWIIPEWCMFIKTRPLTTNLIRGPHRAAQLWYKLPPSPSSFRKLFKHNNMCNAFWGSSALIYADYLGLLQSAIIAWTLVKSPFGAVMSPER